MISTVSPCLLAPTVPNAIPVSQAASAQPERIFWIRGGRASVAKSRSLLRRPSIASLTLPPTRYNR